MLDGDGFENVDAGVSAACAALDICCRHVCGCRSVCMSEKLAVDVPVLQMAPQWPGRSVITMTAAPPPVSSCYP